MDDRIRIEGNRLFHVPTDMEIMRPPDKAGGECQSAHLHPITQAIVSEDGNFALSRDGWDTRIWNLHERNRNRLCTLLYTNFDRPFVAVRAQDNGLVEVEFSTGSLYYQLNNSCTCFRPVHSWE